MSQGNTPVTIVGNLTGDPELRYTAAGAAVASFRIASTPRHFNKQTNDWEDGEGLFLTCNIWRDQAESVTESLAKGMRVIVNGNLRQRSYETREGEKRTVYEVEVEEVGPSLKWATARVTRTASQGGGGTYRGGGSGGGSQAAHGAGGGGYGGQQQGQGYGVQQPPVDDPWGGQQDDGPPY